MAKSPWLAVFFVFLLLSSIYSGAQSSARFDDWGKVSMEELKMTECSFEKNADAILLLDLAQVSFSKNNPTFYSGSNFYVTTAYFQRFKVLTEKGLHRASFKQNVNIKSKEEIKNIRAVSYNLVNGQIKKTELSPDDIHTTKLNEYQNQITFSVPAVSAGSVFELRYDREQIVNYTLPTWYFTSSVPSVKSSITVDFLDPLIYYVDKHVKSGELEEQSVPYTSDITMPSGAFSSTDLKGNSITYTTHNLPSFQMEPYTNSSRNYMDWIGFQLKGFRSPLNQSAPIINSLSSFAQMTMDNANFSFNLTGFAIPKKEWKSLIKEGMSNKEKAQVIFEFVRSNMKWNGMGGYLPKENNTKIWKDKTGSRAEINLLLINILRQAGVAVYPMVISSRAKGYVNNQYPILDDFVGVDALVVLGGDSDMVLDATSKYLPFGLPSFEQLNTYGLVLRGGSDGYHWYRIKDKSASKEFALITGEMDESGHLTGEITLYINTYAASGLISMKAMNKQEAIADFIKARIPNATIESVKDSQDIDKCAFYYKVKFSAQAPTDNEGNVYLSIPAVYGSSTNTFVNKERTSDVDMGYRFRSDIVVQIKVPDSFVLDSLVPSVSLSMQDTSITFMYDAEMLSGAVTMRQRLDYLTFFYPVDKYPAFYEFFQKYYTLKQKPVTLKKKS
jgi:hypothetical protein